jgi:hypothetical protein
MSSTMYGAELQGCNRADRGYTDALHRVILRLEKLSLGGAPGRYDCPACGSTDAMSVSTGHTHRVVLCCVHGCRPATILEHVGLNLADLFNTRGDPPRPPLDELEQLLRNGEVEPVDVLGAPPSTLPPHVLQLAEELRHLFALNAAVGERRPMPCACRWLADRLDWRTSTGEPDKARVYRALKVLVREGFIARAGDLAPRGGRHGTALYTAPDVRRPVPAARQQHRLGTMSHERTPRLGST